MADWTGMLAMSLTFIGLGVCVLLRYTLLRYTGFLTFSGSELLCFLASTASLVGIAVGVYWLVEGSPGRQLQGSVLAAGGGVGLAVCAAALIARSGNGRNTHSG
jgi:hypothetical protein